MNASRSPATRRDDAAGATLLEIRGLRIEGQSEEAWHEIVGYFYSGRLFKSFQVGEELLKTNMLMRMVFPHMQKHFGAIFTGLASNSNYSLGLLRWVMKNSLRDEDPADLAIL